MTTSPPSPPLSSWSASEQEYLLSLVSEQMMAGPWVPRWDYIAAHMMHRFGPIRVYNGPVVRAEFMRLRQCRPYAPGPNPPYCFGPADHPSPPARQPSPPPRATCEDSELGISKVRILDRIGPRMEYRFVPPERLLSDPETPVGAVAAPKTRIDAVSDHVAVDLVRTPTSRQLFDSIDPFQVVETRHLLPLTYRSEPGRPWSASTPPDPGRPVAVLRRNYTKWSAEEELALQEIVQESPLDWDLIVRRMLARFPHGRNYTVGSLKKKVQYVPVGRPPAHDLWAGAGAQIEDDHPRLDYGTGALAAIRAESEPDSAVAVAIPPGAFPDVTPEESVARSIAVADCPPQTMALSAEPDRRSAPAFPSPPPAACGPVRPGRDPSPPPASGCEPMARMEPELLEAGSEPDPSDDRLLTAAIARVVHDLGLAAAEAGPDLLETVAIPRPGFLHHSAGNVAAGGVKIPTASSSDPQRSALDRDPVGVPPKVPTVADPSILGTVRRPRIASPSAPTEQPTWRRWLHKLTTLKTALGVP